MFLLAFLQYVYVCSTAALQHERSMVFADLAIPPEEERWLWYMNSSLLSIASWVKKQMFKLIYQIKLPYWLSKDYHSVPLLTGNDGPAKPRFCPIFTAALLLTKTD